MTYEVIWTIIDLLTTLRPHCKEFELINQLNNFFNFDHNIFLLHSSIDIDRFVCTSGAAPQSLYIYDEIGDNNTGFEMLGEISSKSKLLIVAPNNSNFDSNLHLLASVENIQLLNINLKIGLFFSHNARDDLQKIFQWCWDHRIVNIFATFYSNDKVIAQEESDPLLNIFNFNPFGTFGVRNITGNESIHKIFHDKKINLQQHKLRMAKNDNGNVNQYSGIKGPDVKMWDSVFSVMNATFSIFWASDDVEHLEILDNGTIDIHAELTELSRIVTIYPMMLEILTVVVPKARPYPEFAAYLQTVTSDSFFAYALVTIVLIIFLITVFRYIKYKKILLYQSAADILNLLMNDNGAIKYQQLSYSEMFLVIPLTFAGMIIVNGILSILQSYLTRPIMQLQIDTVEDLYYSRTPILSPNEFWIKKETELLNNLLKPRLKHGDFTDRMRLSNNTETVYQYLVDKPISFTEFESVAKIICTYKRYHVTQLQLSWIWYSYNLRYDFPFIERINEIIQWVRVAGLYDKWWRDEVQNSINVFISTNVAVKNDIEEFPVPMFIIYGWIASVIALIIEIIWKKCKISRFSFFKLKLNL